MEEDHTIYKKISTGSNNRRSTRFQRFPRKHTRRRTQPRIPSKTVGLLKQVLQQKNKAVQTPFPKIQGPLQTSKKTLHKSKTETSSLLDLEKKTTEQEALLFALWKKAILAPDYGSCSDEEDESASDETFDQDTTEQEDIMDDSTTESDEN